MQLAEGSLAALPKAQYWVQSFLIPSAMVWMRGLSTSSVRLWTTLHWVGALICCRAGRLCRGIRTGWINGYEVQQSRVLAPALQSQPHAVPQAGGRVPEHCPGEKDPHCFQTHQHISQPGLQVSCLMASGSSLVYEFWKFLILPRNKMVAFSFVLSFLLRKQPPHKTPKLLTLVQILFLSPKLF